jgi:hypothetical protein
MNCKLHAKKARWSQPFNAADIVFFDFTHALPLQASFFEAALRMSACLVSPFVRSNIFGKEPLRFPCEAAGFTDPCH